MLRTHQCSRYNVQSVFNCSTLTAPSGRCSTCLTPPLGRCSTSPRSRLCCSTPPLSHQCCLTPSTKPLVIPRRTRPQPEKPMPLLTRNCAPHAPPAPTTAHHSRGARRAAQRPRAEPLRAARAEPRTESERGREGAARAESDRSRVPVHAV